MNTKKTPTTTAIKKVYEQIIAIFFFGKPSDELTTLFHQDFMGYGTAAHEFLDGINDLIKLTETQSAQLKTHPITITRKPIYEKFLVNNTSYLIVEELNMHDEQNDYRFTARLSVILENFSSQWLVTHFHASTPDANVDTEEAFPMEGLRKKNQELEEKIKERTRDLEIEAALERVRTQTMAMHDTGELSEVVATLLQELTKLDFSLTFCIINIVNLSDNSNTVWATNPEEGKAPESYYMKFEDYPFHHAMMKEWKAQTPKFVYVMEGEEKKIYDDYLYTDTEFRRFPKEVQDANRKLERYVASFVFSKFGGLQTVGNQPLPDESLDILYRFGKVFDQAYTRFQDLQKAESQARESEIELALERVRARTMGMQNSDELPEVANNLFLQVQALGIPAWSAGYCIWEHEDKKSSWCNMSSEGEIQKGFSLPTIGEGYNFSNPIKHGEMFHVAELGGKKLVKHYDFMKKLPIVGEILVEFDKKGIELPTFQIFHIVYFSHGYLMFITYEPVPNDWEIFKRFGKVFDQTYTRFLDLKKAEAQAKEAKIETALEKVRSRTMAMQKGDELQEVAVLLYKELIALGVTNFVTCGYVEIREDIQRQLTWVTAPGGDTLGLFYLPLTGDATFDARYAAWKRQQPIFHQTVKGEERSKHLEFAITTFNSKEAEEMVRHQFPDPTVFYCFNFSHGYLHLVGGSVLEKEEEILLARFTKVFEQTYTRFLDLEKAEAQAREAKIETALEKVRSRTMAMHKSEELLDVITVVSEQLIALNFKFNHVSFANNNIDENYKFWTSAKGKTQPMRFIVPYVDITIFKNIKVAQQKSLSFFTDILTNAEHKEWHNHLLTHDDRAKVFTKEDNDYIMSKGMARSIAINPNIMLILANYASIPYTAAENKIIERFGQVFEQSYTRFLDLQKAEAQAKEAKIEVALEKVRSRTMGMQKSDELADVANVLFQEMNNLVQNLWTCGFVLCEKDRQEDEWWLSLEDGFSRGFFLPNVNDYAHSHLYEGWLKKDDFRTVQLEGDDLQAHYNWLMEVPVAKSIFDEMEAAGMQRPEWQKLHAAYFSKGYLVIITREPCPEEAIFKRFAQVFDLTYTRFLDLQKSEAQAKEAKIEASLEKVRTVALSLKKSDDMLDIAQVLYEQLLELGFTDVRNAIIDIHNDENETFLDYDYSHDMSSAVTEFSYYGDPVIEQQIKKTQSANDAFFEIELKGKELEELIETRLRNGEKDDPRLHKTDHLTYNLYSFGNGAIGISNFGILSDDQKEILKRFRNVFTFAYKRYADLANAEAQAMEAKIEASLEKVRSVALGLNKSDDMLEVAQALYEQLLALGFNNIRNSIIDIDNGDGLTFSDYDYSHEMGGTVTQMSYKDDPKLKEQLEDIIATTDGFSELILEGKQLQDLIEMRRNNGETEDPRLLNTDSLSYILYAFGKGAIGISNFGVLPDYQKSILSRFRNVFTFAYQRYTDLAQSEAQAKALLAEKQQLEKILTDLKATQAQLIQQEKLASLGQLTAGIAHEIKNPLNFVNNFSEVSNELIDEVFEELEKLDDSTIKAEIKAILDDVKGNLIKVHEHGTRADGIVKSMLQHSRGGSGKMESIDLNALIKEYVNLAFHGMRAKKNPINVTIDLQLDPKIKSVSLIGEDFSRVILNLCNNAFDAMRETADKRPAKLTVRTKQEPNAIQIEVEDNGPGIPDAIKDKILQPFFTTKKGTEGTGLGLSITHDIVKAHGGELKVASRNGEETIFTIRLPKN